MYTLCDVSKVHVHTCGGGAPAYVAAEARGYSTLPSSAFFFKISLSLHLELGS